MTVNFSIIHFSCPKWPAAQTGRSPGSRLHRPGRRLPGFTSGVKAGDYPGYSGGTARELHPVPYSPWRAPATQYYN